MRFHLMEISKRYILALLNPHREPAAEHLAEHLRALGYSERGLLPPLGEWLRKEGFTEEEAFKQRLK